MLNCGITGSTGVLGKLLTKKLNYNFLPFKGKVENKLEVFNWIKNNNFHIIIHLAAIVATDDVNNNFKKAKKVNYNGTKNIINAISKHQPTLKYFFFTSTSHVYKTLKYNKRISEKAKISPSSKYGLTKKMAENYIIKKLNKLKINYCIARIFSLMDKNQKKTFVIPALIKKIKNNKKKNIVLKNLNHYRDFLSSKKISQAINILIKKKSTGIYNIGSGKLILLENIAKHISKKFNKSVKFQRNKKTYLIANNKKIKKIGFLPKYNFYKNLNKIIYHN